VGAAGRLLYSCPVEPDGLPVRRQQAVAVHRWWLQPGASIPQALSQRARFRERFLPGRPLLWVETTVGQFLLPFWLPNAWHTQVAGRHAAESPPLPEPICAALQRCGVDLAVSPAAVPPPHLLDARGQFTDLGYVNLGGLLGVLHARSLGSYCRALLSRMTAIGDTQCARRFALHNEPLVRFFHHQLAAVMARVAGQPVLPSYCYLVGYREGAVLERHTDREQCEFTISLLVDAGPDCAAASSWPLWLDTKQGALAVHQVPGDALLFRGRQLPHWRPALGPRQWSHSLLLHYVPIGFTGPLH
jgi:hypothetical protein